MKKEYFYCLGTFFLGLGIGSLVTYLIEEKKYKEVIENEVFKAKLPFQKKVDFPLDKDSELKEEDYFIHPENEEERLNFDHSRYNIYKPNPDLNAYMEEHFRQKEEIRDQKILEEFDRHHQSMIQQIHPTEYGNIEEYEQYSLTYFEDGVLIDEDDNEILDAPYLIGYDFEKGFGKYGEDPDLLTVRNDNLQTYFEITREHCEYYRDVLTKKYSSEDED